MYTTPQIVSRTSGAALARTLMQTELTTDPVSQLAPDRIHQLSPISLQASKSTATNAQTQPAACLAATQRVRTVRIPTQVHPDLLISYLYDMRGSHSITEIESAIGCTIDYCASTPDEPERSPQSHAYMTNFLISACSREILDSATRQLNELVDQVQGFLQKKTRMSRPTGDMDEVMDKNHYYSAPRNSARGRRGLVSRGQGLDAMASTREVRSNERRMYEEAGEDWNVAREHYAPDGSRIRKRPRYRIVTDIEANEKSEDSNFGFDDEVRASYVQKKRSLSHFAARRRVRRYSDQPRRSWKSYPDIIRDVEYSMYPDPSQDEEKRTQRVFGNRQPLYVSNTYEQSGYGPFVYEDSDVDNDAVLEDAAHFPYEDEDWDDFPDARNALNLSQSMRHTHARRNLKRPLRNAQSGCPKPPLISRQRRPYKYEYAYDDDEEDWMTEDDELAYGRPPLFRSVEMPAFRRRRRFDSTPQWGNRAARGSSSMYERRRLPRDNLNFMDDMVYRAPSHEHVIRDKSRRTTARLNQSDKVFVNAEPQPTRARYITNRIEISAEDKSSMSTSSIKSLGNAGVDAENCGFFANDNIAAEVAIDEAMDFVNQELDSSTQGPMLDHTYCDQEFQSACDEGAAKDHVQECVHLRPGLQSKVTLTEIDEARAALVSPAKSDATLSSPTRKPPENREIKSQYFTGGGACCDAPRHVGSATKLTVGSVEQSQQVSNMTEVSHNHLPFDKEAMTFETGACIFDENQDTQPGSRAASTLVDNVLTDTIRINNHIIASLERVNKVEADFVQAQTLLSVQEDKFRRLANNIDCHRRLAVICGMIYNLQNHISFPSCNLNDVRKQKLLDKLDCCLESLHTDGEQTLEQKANELQTEVEHVLSTDGLICLDGNIKGKSGTSEFEVAALSLAPSKCIELEIETIGKDWENDEWYDESASTGLASEKDQDFIARFDSSENNVRFEDDLMSIKLEQKAFESWPQGLPPFIKSFLNRVILSDSQSFVMKATSRRLVDEIARGDPYYYLHPTRIANDTEKSMPSLRSRPCDFGCGGTSAVKWKRKLVSQISSRMKFFDSVAYLLARRSGGEEGFNRKKLNSIIRKLHLVAMQLHSLVSHLYCIKGHATCKENDSLSTALSSSHFARRMGVYKSKLKLVVPPAQQLGSVGESTEELLYNTFEFFPELLLFIDIWGYNYRESQCKRHASDILRSGESAGSNAQFPLKFFREVETLAFDFEHDNNKRLCLICDELLNIVFLWNDLKWTDELEDVALDRVISFETNVTASILKILELYAQHLQALWAVRLLDEPEQLQSVHFTQLNSYYSDRSRRSLSTTTSATSCVGGEGSIVDRLVAKEIVEQRLVEGYWNRKVTALSLYNLGDDTTGMSNSGETSIQQLSIEAISSWNKVTLNSYLLRWSDVYEIRNDVNLLSVVTSHMLKHELQKYRISIRDHHSDPIKGISSEAITILTPSQLLTIVSRAQMLLQDALSSAEKLALHSACHQLLDERKHPEHAKEIESGAAASMNANSSLPSKNTQSCAALNLESHKIASESKATDNYANGNQDEVIADKDIAQDQPELKDLIQLLAVTKKDMQELCGRKPRSARVRAKVQTRSLQLARQTIEIFCNIRNMYESQRR